MSAKLCAASRLSSVTKMRLRFDVSFAAADSGRSELISRVTKNRRTPVTMAGRAAYVASAGMDNHEGLSALPAVHVVNLCTFESYRATLDTGFRTTGRNGCL